MRLFLGVVLFALVFGVSGSLALSGPGQVKVPVIKDSFCGSGTGHKQIGTLTATREKGRVRFQGRVNGAQPGHYVVNLYDGSCNLLLQVSRFKVDQGGGGNFTAKLILSFGKSFFLDFYNQDADVHNSTPTFELGSSGSSGSSSGGPGADLGITKSVDNSTPNVGDTVTFTATVTNNGPILTATDVTVNDLLPAGLTFVSATPSQGTYVPGTGVWNVGSVATGTPQTLSIQATVASLPSTNTASISHSDQPDSNPANDSASVTIQGSPAIGIVKFVNGQDANTATGPHVAAGSTVTFTYVVTNTGNVPLANVVVTDDKLGTVTSFTGDTNGNGLLDLTETWTYTTTATAAAGQQTNTGTATGQFDVQQVSDNDPANYFGDAPGVNIVKFVNGQDADSPTGPIVTPGSTVTFTYVVTNTGNVPLANVVVTDDKLGTVIPFTGDTNGNGLLDLTETWTYTTTATAAAGQQTNTGTVTAQDANNPPGTPATDNNPGNYFGGP